MKALLHNSAVFFDRRVLPPNLPKDNRIKRLQQHLLPNYNPASNAYAYSSGSELIVACADAARVCAHSTVVYHMLPMFLDYKTEHGSSVEREFYRRHSVESLLQRLINDRPLCFFGSSNETTLRDGSILLPNPTASWMRVGTDDEDPRLTLENYLSFDEMMLSALIGASAPTPFINCGDRNNRGIANPNNSSFNPTGVYVGLVGARFEMPEHMEAEYVLIDRRRSTPENGFGIEGRVRNRKAYERLRIFARVFGEPSDDGGGGDWYFPSYKEVETMMIAAAKKGVDEHDRLAKKRFIRLNSDTFFNVDAYRRRVRINAETLLLEANQRCAEQSNAKTVTRTGAAAASATFTAIPTNAAAAAGTTTTTTTTITTTTNSNATTTVNTAASTTASTEAFVHVVGLGLGVWQILDSQNQIFVDAFGQALQYLWLPHVKVVNFSWINNVKSCCGAAHGEEITGAAGNKIVIEFSKRNPADRFAYYDEGKLLVASFAWDSNSYVGNEYWRGMLAASGDPAAVACSIIGEILNPEINKDFTSNVALLDPTADGNIITTRIDCVEARLSQPPPPAYERPPSALDIPLSAVPAVGRSDDAGGSGAVDSDVDMDAGAPGGVASASASRMKDARDSAFDMPSYLWKSVPPEHAAAAAQVLSQSSTAAPPPAVVSSPGPQRPVGRTRPASAVLPDMAGGAARSRAMWRGGSSMNLADAATQTDFGGPKR
ncbi:hypothetical protein HDU82_000066 [Entophlyctis luteolus]|nr:hypothetical protein HDU82_000066 [Entophlyctis luteolus]